jgi:twinkle protein
MKTWADVGIDLPTGAHGELDLTCPECTPGRKREHQRSRDLSVNVEQETWICHHCGWKGGLNGKSDGIPAYGARLKQEWSAPRPLPQVLVPTLWQKAVSWFAERGIPEAVLARNGVTTAEEFCPVCEGSVGHILFPYVRDGQHINTKHRCGKKHFRMEKGAERILYGLDDVATKDTIIIVEGEIDKLSVEVAGFPNCLSVPDGAPAPDAQSYTSKFAFLTSAESVITSAKQIILATDADAPGQKLLEELARRIGPEKCSRVTWPVGIKDANEALVQVGPDFLRSCIVGAEPFPVEGIITVADLSRDLDDLYDHGFDSGVSAGWIRFDRHYRVRTGLFTVLTGVPGHGKSHFLDQLMVRLAVVHGWAFGICSPENQPLARHQAGILSTYLGKPFWQGPTERMSKTELAYAKSWASHHFAFILPEEPTVDAILERARVLVYRMGIKGLVVDPWNEIEHSRPPGKSETEYVSECLGRLRRFARHHNIHVWLVAHPTKLRKNDDGSEPVPGLWDISGSAHFRNKADAGLTIWRDIGDPSRPVQVHVMKIRFSETGEEGVVEFSYDKATGQYREVSS